MQLNTILFFSFGRLSEVQDHERQWVAFCIRDLNAENKRKAQQTAYSALEPNGFIEPVLF